MTDAEIIAQALEIQRRRQLLSQSQQQSMNTQIQGNNKTDSIVQALSKLGTSYFQGKQGENLVQQEAANKQAYGDSLQQALANHIDMREGKPGQTLSDDQAANLMYFNEDPGQLREPIKGNPRRAAITAMASQMPELQAIGKAEYSGIGKEQINPLDYLKLDGYDAQSKVAAALGGGSRVLQGKKEYKDANGQIIELPQGDGGPKVLGDYRDKFGAPTAVNGEAVQFETGTGKAHQVANRPPQTHVNVLPNAQKAGLEQLFKDYATNVSNMGKSAQESVRLQGALNQLGQLSAAGTYSGPVADAAVWLNRLGNAAGVPIDKDKLSNSETYGSVAAEAAQRLIGQFGGNRGVTKEEADQIKTITPQLATSPQARAQLTQILSTAATRNIENYKAAHSNYVKAAQANDATLIDPLLYNSQLPIEAPVGAQPGAGANGPIVKNW